MQDNTSSSVYGQLFNKDGEKRGAEFRVNSYTNSKQNRPSVSYLKDGGFVVCWQSWEQDNSGYGIYGQLFNNDGSKRGTEFQLNTYTNNDQSNPSVSYLAEEGFVVCWESKKQDGSNLGVFGNYYHKDPKYPLTSFSLKGPANDMTIQATEATFNWYYASDVRTNFSWEIEYHLYLDNSEDFSNPQIIRAIYDTTCTLDSLTPGTTYFWKVLAKNISRDSLWSSETKGFFISHDATGVKEKSLNTPEKFQLHANFPNPFNPETTIKYSLPAEKSFYNVVIKIYDALGKLVLTLKDEPQKPGVYTVKWNGKDAASLPMPSGIYFCVIQAGTLKAVQKMLLVK